MPPTFMSKKVISVSAGTSDISIRSFKYPALCRPGEVILKDCVQSEYLEATMLESFQELPAERKVISAIGLCEGILGINLPIEQRKKILEILSLNLIAKEI
jgi:hypothetical protein